jgi:pimeloyl-ACP methyl ester carboxylesterase
MSTIHVNGVEFYYELAGRGPAVVLVHAGIADSRMWDGQFEALAAAHTVLRYDLRGFGRTPPAPGPFDHADDLRALLDGLGLTRVALVGCSLGSRTALIFALSHPARVERLVLSSPAISGLSYDGPPPRQAAELDAADEAGDRARVNELEMQIWVDGPRRRPDEVAPAVRALAADMNAIALANEGIGQEQRPLPAAERLGEVGAPALVVAGELDAARTLAAAEALLARLPHARRVTIANAAHLPNMEQPEVFNAAVLAFLE